MGDPEVDEGKRATLRRFAAVGAVGPLARLADRDEDDESDARDAITGYLAATPGAHFSKVRDDLELGTGETQHHLRRLENDAVVESDRDGDYRRYFPAREFDSFEKVALGVLRRETPRGMVIALLRDPDASASDLATDLGVSRPTVSKHAADLEDAGVLSRGEGYALVRPELLLTLLVRYANSFDVATLQFAREADRYISVEG
ncbi:ArsR family transcriptional regulator [Halococcus sp. IIIV-5B]|uniref:winged helix-turn-helix transcriptional regulator n=1 Tax=Halococcus sp. IIIV-5B TaxID=2321230 RepID=UPI000E70805E|nr:ArsR family transcriptional regulator [Halococcus sp. IIIV-5B]RJT01412.1 ArsR family transcriptional regulator [Halococcus sp. IIIV-5B]